MASFFCAGQAPPSGGPPDTTPPEIRSSVPEPNSLNVHEKKIKLKFSEYVNQASVEQSVFFSPPVGELTYHWSGDEVEIEYSDSLRENTTYIMILGTDAKDSHGNKFTKTFSLPFSTGNHIDSAAMNGKVFDKQPHGAMIFAYQLDHLRPDTLNPSHTKPDYITQSGKEGSFTLTNMAIGEYRLLAVRDEFKDLLFDPQTDEVGMMSKDIVLTNQTTVIDGVQFRMAKEDTVPPFLSSARSLDRTHVLLHFSEAMKFSLQESLQVLIGDTLKGSWLNIIDVSLRESAPSDVELVTVPQDSDVTYRVTVHGLQDIVGNLINPKVNNIVFSASTLSDTSRPVLTLLGITDSSTAVQLDDSIHFTFSEAVQRNVFEHGLILTDADGQNVAGTFIWNGSLGTYFIPTHGLSVGTSYTLKIVMDSLKDFSGNSYHDSVLTRHFRMVEEKTLSSIKGNAIDPDNTARGSIHIIASEISKKSIKPKEITIARAGVFEFLSLPEGMYTLFAYRDADSNNIYSFGKPFPFQPAERFIYSSDTLKLRARWPLEGAVLTFH